MNATMDDLLIIIGRQAVQIALLEAQVMLRDEPPVEHKALSSDEQDAVRKAFSHEG